MRTLLMTSFCWLATAALCATASAQTASDMEMSSATRKVCDAVADAAPPPSDLPSPDQLARLKGCDAEALYYGIGRPAAPVQARLCAFAQRPNQSSLGAFEGDSILMVIYTNGVGAQRNLRLAAHLACGTPSAPAEFYARVPDLMSKLKAGWAGHDFSYCDDITSGLSAGACEAHKRRIASAARDVALNAYAARLQGHAAARFADLRKAQAGWAEARSDNEVDMSGTFRAASAIDEQEMQDKDFLAMIQRLAGGKPPQLGAAQLKAAMARMEETLHRIQAANQDETDDWGTVSVSRIA
jgi:hypothetical protein